MTDYFEIDFLSVGDHQSGDAITLRYSLNGRSLVHVVDGGFLDDGEHVMTHLRKYYGGNEVSHVVLTHPDADHAGGLEAVLKECEAPSRSVLWMLRPWLYAAELRDHFPQFLTVAHLKRALREAYPNVAKLEEIAKRRGIPIREPFQRARIGEFTVLAPSKARYLQLIRDSEKTPAQVTRSPGTGLLDAFRLAGTQSTHYAKAAWGVEAFSDEPTSAENEMSVVQFARLCDESILLTGDAGRGGLSEAADFAPSIGLRLPGINRFDVPHHGSRRNLSTDVLDRWLGPRLLTRPLPGSQPQFRAFISANSDDQDHPRRAVVRGLIHRGGDVLKPSGKRGAYLRTSKNAPRRAGAVPGKRLPYPEDQEEG